MGTDLWPFTDQGHIGIADAIAHALRHLGRVGQEDLAGSPFPAQVRRRKMLADVAHGQGTIDRIRQGMHPDIGIGMTVQPLVKRQLYAAQPQMVTRAEAVDIIAAACSDIHAVAPQEGFGTGKITGPCQLQIAFLTRQDGDCNPGSTRHFDIIGGLCAIGPVGGKDRIMAETLRGLRPPQPVARHRGGNLIAGAAPQGIGHRQRRRNRLAVGHRGNQTPDQGSADQRPRAIVDHHMADAAPLQSLQPGADRCGAGRTATNRTDPPLHHGPDPPHILRMHHHHNRPDLCHTGKGADRMGQDRNTRQHLPLLWHVAPGPHTATGCNDDGGNRHAISISVCQDCGEVPLCLEDAATGGNGVAVMANTACFLGIAGFFANRAVG